jgi:hypothetical protein
VVANILYQPLKAALVARNSGLLRLHFSDLKVNADSIQGIIEGD